MPGSLTTPDRPGARNGASGRVAFRKMHCVGTQNRKLSRLNGWPMRPPVNASPRPSRAPAHELGADVDRYSFIARDLHPLLLAGLPAHANVFRFAPDSGPPICALMSTRPSSLQVLFLRAVIRQASHRREVPIGNEFPSLGLLGRMVVKLPHRRLFLHLAAGAAALPVVSRFASAQAYPSRPVRIVVGFAAGTGADIIARLMGQWLAERLGQSVIIENRAGGRYQYRD